MFCHDVNFWFLLFLFTVDYELLVIPFISIMLVNWAKDHNGRSRIQQYRCT